MNQKSAPSLVTVLPERLFDSDISPFIYGDFVEYLNDLIPGMRAEKIQDRSFEGVAQPVHVWPPDASWTAPWWSAFVTGQPHFVGWPDTAAHLDMVSSRAQVTLDTTLPFVGHQSARVEVVQEGQEPFVAGIAQSGIALTAGQQLNVEFYARGDAGRLTLLLGQNDGVFFQTYASLRLEGLTGEWQRFTGALTSAVSSEEATLAIGLDSAGTFWLDKVSLQRADSPHGWRGDVVAAVRALKPGIIRFGGSSLIYYHWETGIGPRERRVPFVNHPWGNREEHDVGLHEFLDFCELVEAEPLICVNANSTTVEQILDEIEYCNGAVDSPYGRIRAAMGHPKPFNVRYWQIGNEQEGQDYERVLAEYARAIRHAHPHLILLASYPSDRILTQLSGDLDYICPHYYDPYTEEGEAELHRLIVAIQQDARNKDLKIAVTEWNHTAGHWGWARAWLLTLYNALNAARMFNMYQRLGNMIRIANRSNMTNSCCSGVVQTSPSDLYLTPAYYVQAAYANLAGERALAVRTTPDEVLDIAATRRGPDGEVALFVVNYLDQPQTRRLDLAAVGTPRGLLRVWTLAGPSLEAINSFEDKTRVAPRETEQTYSQNLQYTFPPYSLTILRWTPHVLSGLSG